MPRKRPNPRQPLLDFTTSPEEEPSDAPASPVPPTIPSNPASSLFTNLVKRSPSGFSSHADRVKASRPRARSLYDDIPDTVETIGEAIINPPAESKEQSVSPSNGDSPRVADIDAPLPAGTGRSPDHHSLGPGLADTADFMQYLSELPTGGKARARDLLNAIRVMKQAEGEGRPANADECLILARFGGFGPVALSVFPDPVTDQFKDGWGEIGEELKSLLTPQEYDSAKRTTFNAFYTFPVVIQAMQLALSRLGVSAGAKILEPGCGIGRFINPDFRFIGVEMDGVSGRIARLLHPGQDIRIENFRDTRLPELDAVIGNVPFADVKLDHHGQRFSLHDYFFAKSVDALKPAGVLALVTSHFTLDKQNPAIREYLAGRADFLGAIRLPSDAFKREGTAVVTDIVFLRKRVEGQEPAHADPDWLGTSPLNIGGVEIPINRYFLNHPEMVLGTWGRKDNLYREGYSVTSNGDLSARLHEAVKRLPAFEPLQSESQKPIPLPVETPRPSSRNTPPAFVPPPPPPPLPHISEGSFFIGEDRIIRQVEDGRSEPVTYGGVLQKADCTMGGRRFGSLIELRDLSRRVLQSQNEDWPMANREEARRALNRAYDRFVMSFGPVNKTTFSETKDGTSIRRMPNLVKFREDPDAMLVMSLEEYDEATGKAEKAAIMRKDVVGPKPPVTRVASAEEGLLVSLDHKGGIDLPYIATLYGKPGEEIVAELGDLIYRDPELKQWQTADTYLSGNVRSKLVAAGKSGPEYARNVEALSQVQPEDVLPGDIDANLGAPWIPASDVRAFAGDLFGVTADSFKVGHLKKDAVWTLEPDYRAMNSVAATADYGTARINGTSLLDQALNLKTPVIYDMVMNGGREERVVNQTETLAAREKQKQIREKFKAWIFSDPDRTERLVRDYNDTYNNLRPRLFDGSHLKFPGMSRAVTLRPHQVDAVWRCMTAGNTLLAHVVGAGKTNVCIASAMKMKQAGLVNKPMIVCPNHMLEQFSREWLQLYPNAKLLVASKEDFTKERRKFLTAKIATGDWEGIIVTHSSFERIGMSGEYQQKFLRDQIKEYEQLLLDKAPRGRNIIKTLEKQKANREEKLKNLLAEDKKDDGLVFDELGVDQLFIDEFQAYKNLEAPTKMDRVAGIASGGSERSFDLFMKAVYLDEKHPGYGLVGASGTPISNSMVEMYTVQRYFDPAGLRSRGIEHFDGWAATFGEVVDTMEISPDGASLRPRSRFARFVNLPELTQMFRAFADVQTADMLDLPRPSLEGGKPKTVACPMSEQQHELQTKLIERYDRIRSQKIDPRVDNALAITTDGRKLALDGRMLGAAGDFPGSKVNALVRNVVAIWKKAEDTRGTQLVFCDMGVHPNPFSVYDEIASKLADHGIPACQIAIMGDADTDAKKQALFEKVRQGTVRVLIGSTTKMGTGTNVQKRLVALHHLDAPWKPAEVEQREGRILRQGNLNEEVAIYRYVTESSFDAYMWQALETKARFIAQVMSGDCAVRKAEDIGGQELSYAEVKAIASGNPAVLTLAEADAELQRLAILRKNHHDEQYLARRNLRELPATIRRLGRRVSGLESDMEAIKSHQGDPVTINNHGYSRDDAMPVLGRRLEQLPTNISETRMVPMGKYRGLWFGLVIHPLGGVEACLEGEVTRRIDFQKDNPGPRAVFNALDRLIDSYPDEHQRSKEDLKISERQLHDYETRLGKTFAHEDFQRKLTGLRDRLKLGLSEKATETDVEGPTVDELAMQIQNLRASNMVESVPPRAGAPTAMRAERPVTARIREKAVEKKAVVESEMLQPSVVEDEDTAGSPASFTDIPGNRPSGFGSRVSHARKDIGNDSRPGLFG
ncbi:helicase-related protein [Zavarzinella formosa]|uniref:helicase-related protein n=1 Tax=Zavarzinella formosa TaxID=360055 RepID=UPI0002F8B0C9|nr:helicase-related protein [Zavarzinella formosa]